MSSDARLPKVPEGCTVFALPGWAMRQNEADAELVPAGGILLPRFFFLNVKTPEGVTVVLQFAVNESGEVELPQVWSHHADVPDALEALRAVEPLEFWRRYAITHMVARELNRTLTDHPGEDQEAAADVRTFLAKVHQGAAAVPPRGRRNRITDQHLAEVAEVYQAADRDGRPPTQAVADHFQAPHSTAARWVGMARKRDKLPPAHGDPHPPTEPEE